MLKAKEKIASGATLNAVQDLIKQKEEENNKLIKITHICTRIYARIGILGYLSQVVHKTQKGNI